MPRKWHSECQKWHLSFMKWILRQMIPHPVGPLTIAKVFQELSLINSGVSE